MKGCAVARGQVWIDNDPRCRGIRTMLVKGIILHAVRGPMAVCQVLETGRIVKILVRRFRPTASGYKLVKENGI